MRALYRIRQVHLWLALCVMTIPFTVGCTEPVATTGLAVKAPGSAGCESSNKCIGNPDGLVSYNAIVVTANGMLRRHPDLADSSTLLRLSADRQLLIFSEKLTPHLKGVGVVKESDPCETANGIRGENPSVSDINVLTEGIYKVCIAYIGLDLLERVYVMDAFKVDLTPPQGTGQNPLAGGITSDASTISWESAADNFSTSSQIIYSIYSSTTAQMPTLESVGKSGNLVAQVVAGQSSYSLAGLSPSTKYYVTLVAEDEAGNAAVAGLAEFSTPLRDTTAPTVSSFARDSGQLASVNSLPVNFTMTFSEAVDASTFTAADISNSGTASGVTWQITDSGDSRTFTVAATTAGNGTLEPVLAASAVSDSAGNFSAGSTSASSNTVNYNTSPLSVTVNRASGQAELTNSQSASFTVVFSSAIDAASFTESDITQYGTATGVTWSLSTSDQITYVLSTTAIGGQGTVTPSIAASRVTDVFGNGNSASTVMNNSTNNIVIFDSVVPTLTFSSVSPGSLGSSLLPTVLGTASESSTVTLYLNSSCTSAASAATVNTAFASSGITLTSNVSANSQTTIYGKAVDSAGNASSCTSLAAYTHDGSAPAVSSFTRDSGQLASVNSLPANFTMTFSEAVDASTFTAADISNSGTASGVTWQITDSGDSRTFTVAATAAGNGTLQPLLAASAVSDSAGNFSAGSTSASSNIVNYNTSPLSVTVNRASGQAELTNSQSASFTVVFSSVIDAASFTTIDITQGGTATGVTWSLSTSDQTTYVLSTTAIGGQGTVTPSIAASRVTDVFGNGNSASTVMNNSTNNIVIFDSVAPARPNVSPGSQGFDPPLSVGITGGTDIDFVEFRYTFDVPLILSCSSGSASSMVPTSLTVNVASSLRVIACDQAGNSSEEFTATYNVNVTVPGAPSSVIGVTGNAEVILSWSAPASDGGDTITDYLIQFSSDNGQNWNSYSDGTSASTSASVSGLDNGTSYVFKVAAGNTYGISAFSQASDPVMMAPQVRPVISITSQPAHDLVPTWNESAFFEVSASADPAGMVAYQWQVWGRDPNTSESKWTNVSGQTGSSFSATRNLWSIWDGGVVDQPGDGNGFAVRCVVSLSGADDVISHVARLYDASSVTYGNSYWTDYAYSGSGSFNLGNAYYEQFVWPTSYSNQIQFWSYGMMYSDSSWASSIINVEWQTSADATTWATVESSTANYGQFSVSSPGVDSLYYRMKVSANWPVTINQSYKPTSTDVISQSFSVETTIPPDNYFSHIKINWFDDSAPSVSSFARASGQLASVNSLPANFTMTFSEAVDASTFTAADISNSGTASGVTWQITDSGDSRTFTVAATAAGNGTLQPLLAASAVSDSAGNFSAGSTSASSNTVNYNTSPLSVTVNRASGQAELTNSQSASFTLVFSSVIDAASFTESDITQYGTATGVTWSLSTNDQTTYVLSTTAIGGQGTVTPSIAASMVTDVFGNGNSASTIMVISTNNSTDSTVIFDSVAPARPNVSPGSQGFDPPLSVGITGGTDIDFVEFRYTFDVPLILSCSSGSASSMVPTSLTVNVASSLRVIACDQAGNSSEEFTATYNVNVTVPGAPSSVIGVTGNAEVILSWSAPASDGGDTITDYLIQFSSDNGQNWNSYSDGTSASTSASVSGLDNGTGYIFRVAAVNSLGTGGYSTASGSVIPTVPAEQGTSAPDYYFSNTKILLHMEGSNQGQSFVDSSSGGLGISSVNNAITVTAVKNFGTASGFLQDNGYLSVENNPSLNFGTGAFTIESWVYLQTTTTSNRVLFARLSGDYGVGTEQLFQIESDHAHIYYGVRGSSQAHIKLFWSTNFTYDQWHHVVFQRDNSGVWSAFLDGKISTSYAFSSPQGGVSYGPTTNGNLTNAVAFDGAITPSIGGSSITGSLFGYVDDFRVSNIARYTGSFTSPSFPFANSQSTPTLPDVPGYVLATSGDSQLTVSWSSGFSDGGAAISDYLIQVSYDGGTHWVLVDEGVHTARSSVISGLVNGTNYVFKVAAINANGTSAYSSASDPVAPQVKSVISITSQPAHDLVPTWNESAFFEVSASADPAGMVAYQWQVWGRDPNTSESKWTNVSGQTGSSFSATRNLWSIWDGGVVDQPWDGNGFAVRCVVSLSGADDVISHVARLYDASSVTYGNSYWTDYAYSASGSFNLGNAYYEQFDFPTSYSNQMQFWSYGMMYSDSSWASSIINVEWQTSADATTWATVESSTANYAQFSVSNPGVQSLYYRMKVSANWPVTINQSYKPTSTDVISQSFSVETTMPPDNYLSHIKINWIE